MGWVAYKVTRTNATTGAELGEMALIFPKVEQRFTVGSGGKTMAELLQYTDFPAEMHVLCREHGFNAIKSFGFGNALDIANYQNETWKLNNNSTINIGTMNQRGQIAYSFRYPDGSSWFYSSTITGSGITYGIEFLPCVVGDNMEGLIDSTYIEKGKLYLRDEGYIPTNPPKALRFFDGVEPIITTDDPYGDGGISGGGGGTGSFDGTGDDISIPGLPTLSAVDAGFITLFNPSLEQMHSLSSYMWSDLFDVNGWKKLFADPMGAILGLSIVPVAVPNGGTKEVKVGNIPTGVNMTVAASQYVTVDCGTLNVNEYWGAYLDYDPFTKAEIYLPYIGTHPLATDDIMNKPVHVVYHVDILSGACCANVQCGESVLYSFIGQCASSIPITGDNWTNVINGAISIAGSIGSMVATGGASAPLAIGPIASAAVNIMKPSVEKSGAMGGTGGMLGVQTPYLILTRPRQALPRDQNAFSGYPSFITERLGDLSGYTEIDSIHLENVPATEPELSEIESLLKSGVIF